MTQKVLRVGSSAAVTIPKKSLEELGLKPGDEVITTPYTFVATAEVIEYFNAKPVTDRVINEISNR